MAKNNELIRVAKKAADEWSNTDAYYQAAQIIDMLIEELESNAPTQPNESLTCDGCISLGTSYGPCINCIRSRLRGDMYRRPLDGEKEKDFNE